MSGTRIVLLGLLVPAVALAQKQNPYIDQAKALEENLEFEQCLKRVEQGSRWRNSPSQLAELELLSGMCALGLGRERVAGEHFEMALKLDAQIAPPESASPKVLSVFAKARAKIGPVLEAAPEETPPVPTPPFPASELKLPAPDPDAVLPATSAASPPSAATTRVVPEQKHFNPLPFVLAAVGVAALAVGIGLGVEAQSMQQAKASAVFELDAFNDVQQAKTFALAANVTFGLAGAALLGAAIAWLLLR